LASRKNNQAERNLNRSGGPRPERKRKIERVPGADGDGPKAPVGIELKGVGIELTRKR